MCDRHELEGDLADQQTANGLQLDAASKLAGLDALQAEIADIEQTLADERAAVERRAASEKLARDHLAADGAMAMTVCESTGSCRTVIDCAWSLDLGPSRHARVDDVR